MFDAVIQDGSSAAFAALCFLGIALYSVVMSVPGRRLDLASWQLLFVYLGFFPTPRGSSIWIVQQVVLILALGSLAVEVLWRHAVRYRDLRAHEAGSGRPQSGWRLTAAVATPAALLVVYLLVEAAVAVTGRHTEELTGLLYQRAASLLSLLMGVYFGVSFLLGRVLFRSIGSSRLLATMQRFHWMNGIGAIVALLLAIFFLRFSPSSAAGKAVLFAILVVQLAPGVNELFRTHSAALCRMLAANVMVAVAAVILFGVGGLLESVGPVFSTVAVLALFSIAALTLPRPVELWIERILFPRTADLRARLLAITAKPFSSPTRAAAARQLLESVVAALDCEGGIVVLPRAKGEPAVLETARSANPELLGNAADAARRLSRLSLDGGPRWVYTLDAQAQFRLLRSEIELVCPLGDEGSHGTLLLGPRRGWLYDGSIVEALGVFARQAGLALENFGLARAQAHAEKLAALGEAAARIAHEIRNPLSSARSLVQLAAHENGVGPLAETAITELDRISRLVGDLVSFARRDEQMALTDVDLAGVCRDALAQVTPLAAEAGAAIEASLEPVRIRGNADRLVQVVANLCRNGIEALGEGHEPERPRLVRIRCGEAERFAEVSVEDYGAGISPEELELIFEPFRTTKRAGTGLGLSIAQRIVRAHGGELLAESRVGEGTTFRVRFPRSTAGAS